MKITDPYLAGLIDGEGCFYLERKQNKDGSIYLTPSLEVKMSCQKTITTLKQELGGTVVSRPSQKKGWKNQWRWRVKAKLARNTILRIRPYLITKADDADIFIRIWRERGLI